MWGGGRPSVFSVPRLSPADIITLLPATLTHPGHHVCSESTSRPLMSPSFGSLLTGRLLPVLDTSTTSSSPPPALLTGRGRSFTPVLVLSGRKCDLCVVENIWNDPESDRSELVQMLLPTAPQINNKHVFTEIKSFISNINGSDSNFSCDPEITLRQMNQWRRWRP